MVKPGQSKGDVLNFEAVAMIAHDNKIHSCRQHARHAYLTRPLEHGADIVVHSATKFIGGHGPRSVASSSTGSFDYEASGRFPGLPNLTRVYTVWSSRSARAIFPRASS